MIFNLCLIYETQYSSINTNRERAAPVSWKMFTQQASVSQKKRTLLGSCVDLRTNMTCQFAHTDSKEMMMSYIICVGQNEMMWEGFSCSVCESCFRAPGRTRSQTSGALLFKAVSSDSMTNDTASLVKDAVCSSEYHLNNTCRYWILKWLFKREVMCEADRCAHLLQLNTTWTKQSMFARANVQRIITRHQPWSKW